MMAAFTRLSSSPSEIAGLPPLWSPGEPAQSMNFTAHPPTKMLPIPLSDLGSLRRLTGVMVLACHPQPPAGHLPEAATAAYHWDQPSLCSQKGGLALC